MLISLYLQMEYKSSGLNKILPKLLLLEFHAKQNLRNRFKLIVEADLRRVINAT